MKKERETSQRLLIPDILRGVAIFFVIWGNVLQQGLKGVALEMGLSTIKGLTSSKNNIILFTWKHGKYCSYFNY